MNAISSRRARWPVFLLLLGIVALAVLRSAAGTRLDSFTIDEPWHAVAGSAYVKHGDFALNPEHPPLAKLWVGAWLGDGFATGPSPVLREKGDERDYVEGVMYRDNDDRAAQARARAAMWTLNGLLLAAIGLLAWRAFGAAWAVGTLVFLAIEPSVGAYLPVVMTDLPVALALLASALALGLLLAEWRWRWAGVLGVAPGLALGSKHSALPGLAALAVFAAAGFAWQARRATARANLRRAAQLGLALAMAVALLWAHYDFRFHPRPDGSDGFNRDIVAKIDDLQSARMKALLHFTDAHHLLPRAYVWGLADTLRAGMEGRGDIGVFLWGRFFEGPPRWFTWPSLIVSKVPLALLAMALLGLLALWRAPLAPAAKWALASATAMAAGYYASLANAHSAYAGVRHAMPVVAWLALLGGALAWRASRFGHAGVRAAPVLLAGLALAMTIAEPRLWEYHNELAGGTRGAAELFSNESVDLGQRLHEVQAWYERDVAPGTEVTYLDTWAYSPRAYVERRVARMRKRVESNHADNAAGLFDGWFVKEAGARVAAPWMDYDPVEALQGLQAVQRIGNVEIWRGRQLRPRSRDWPLFGRIAKYVYSDGGDDWALVATRAQEIVERRPGFFPAAIELGNARLRLGERAAARAAYAGVLAQSKTPVPPMVRTLLEAQIASLDAARDLAQVAPLRNPAME
jgi:hypothetical protein